MSEKWLSAHYHSGDETENVGIARTPLEEEINIGLSDIVAPIVVYPVGSKISFDEWQDFMKREMVRRNDLLFSVIDDDGVAWLGIGGCWHIDVKRLLKRSGVFTTRKINLQVAVEGGEVIRVTTPFRTSRVIYAERTAQALLRIFPSEILHGAIRLKGNGYSKVIGKNELTIPTSIYFDEIQEVTRSPGFVKLEQDRSGCYYLTRKIPDFPPELKRWVTRNE